MRHLSQVIALAIMILIMMSALPTASRTSAAADSGSIAYVRSTNGTNNEIHLIQPDGSGDHTIVAIADSGIGAVPQLAWKPDATELAFSSDHEATHSLYSSDIYAVRPDGSNLRRLTNGPDSSRLGAYPQGTVTVDVQTPSDGGPYLVYVAGASAPQTALAGGLRHLVFPNVADFGPGRQQFVVVAFGLYRWLNAGNAADVQPAQTVSAGTFSMIGEGFQYKAFRPTWRADGSQVGFVFGSGAQPEQVAANPPDGTLGTDLIESSAIPGFPSLVEYSPVLAMANQLLYDSFDFNGETIYRVTEGASGSGEPLVTFDSPVIDLKWLPQGSGFLVAVPSDAATSNIYEYDFASRRLTQITHFSNEVAGHFSIAPDGQTIVFERAADMDSPADLWLIERDGTNLRLLVQGAARPAWSARVPQVPAFHGTYLPLIQR
jgi:Tol biopolymer transport system component